MKTYIGLAAVDWDHTLKFDDGISQENRQAVAELIGHRLLFTPATGRNFHHMIRDYRQLDKGGPLVTSDGALVSIADGGILSERPLPQDAAAAILEGAHKRRISCLCFHRHG